jgi:hypothetical protein
VQVRLTVKLLDEIEQIAAEDDVSPNAWIEGALLGAVLQRRMPSPPAVAEPSVLAEAAHQVAHDDALAELGDQQVAVVDHAGNRLDVLDVGPRETLDP